MSTHKSPCRLFATSGDVVDFFKEPAVFHEVLSHTYSVLTAVLYHSCPSTGLVGAVGLAKFSNKCKKLLAMIGPYPE